MRHFWKSIGTAAVLVSLTGFAGCGSQPAAPPAEGQTATDEHGHEEGHDHGHGHEGPHGGHVVELGADNYHAELMHDDATHAVGIYMLDGTAAAVAPIEAQEITMNVVADGKPQQYTLAAKPAADDPAGKTSYFEVTDETLCDGLDGGWKPGDATARLNITIEGTPYVGDIELREEGDEHGHDHEEAHE